MCQDTFSPIRDPKEDAKQEQKKGANPPPRCKQMQLYYIPLVSFTPAMDVLPRGSAEPFLEMHLLSETCLQDPCALFDRCCRQARLPQECHGCFSSNPGAVPVGFRWHCVAFLTLQHWRCRLLPSLSFCFADLSNSLCISSVDLNELHSDPHLSPFQGQGSEFSSPFCCSFTWHKSPC